MPTLELVSLIVASILWIVLLSSFEGDPAA